MPSPTHHRAIALVLAVLLALGLTHHAHRPADPARTVAPRVRRATASQPIDPNTADLATLEELPGVGPALAQRVIDARAAGRRFACAADLGRVRGFGPVHIARIAPRLRFATDPPPSEAPPAP